MYTIFKLGGAILSIRLNEIVDINNVAFTKIDFEKFIEKNTGFDTGSNGGEIKSIKVVNQSDSPQIYENFISAAGSNSNLIKTGKSNLSNLFVVNTSATIKFFKLYNKATAPNVGVDIPLITIPLPSGQCGFTVPALVGINFSLGLAFAITSGASDGNSGTILSGDIIATFSFT
jgi:hypothetical protein